MSDNPFDPGLPMVRVPPRKRGRRRRPPAVGDAAARAGGPGEREGNWDDWLETPTGPLEPPAAAEPAADDVEQWQQEPEYDAPEETVAAYRDHEPSLLPPLIDRSGKIGGGRRTPRAKRSTSDDGNSGGRALSILMGVGLAIGIAAVAVVISTSTGGDEKRAVSADVRGQAPQASGQPNGGNQLPTSTAAPTSAPPESPVESPPYAADGCVQQLDGTGGAVVSGTPTGGTGSGADAIFGFEHAYYVARDGHRARNFVTADAAVSDAAGIDRGIAQVPLGTRYCVTITPLANSAPQRFLVDLVQQYPGEPPDTFHQLITVATLDGHTRITRIEKAPS
ncbi:hypothetical protein GV791_26370 [Nocardia cyriacigeorgica]|uniref:DUF8176 domain-containing protein n=1 Tax=Nocardia cyriacigeorgica TaxID=135487 RepID=A0A6P1CXC6_9NOCA|nr:hypothetical protein [Nocardia cyriacigeorgica]MBF6425395.1 hypothetical protein [Nocardia cyriacigeorgica]NEW36066.1 hypothetical protein [Nocardia cyriacigeorgica]